MAAAAWGVLFAVPSFYWALGGRFAIETIAADVDEVLGVAAEPWIVALMGTAKLLMAAFALSFSWPSLPRAPRNIRVVTGYVLAAGLGLYGLTSLAGHLLMLTGVDDIPPALGRTALYWHTFFWDPVWIIGGVLLGLAVRRFATVIAPRAR